MLHAAVLAPTQTYGFALGGEEAGEDSELRHIGEVWRQRYAGLPGLQDVPVPVSTANFRRYGASSMPPK